MDSKLSVNSESAPIISFKDGAVEKPINKAKILFVVKGESLINSGFFIEKEPDADNIDVFDHVWKPDSLYGWLDPISPVSQTFWAYRQISN